VSTEPVELPGMIASVLGGDVVTARSGPNLWWICLAADHGLASDVLGRLDSTSMPSEALRMFGRELLATGTSAGTDAMVAKLELDVCGAWLTVSNASAARPVVVRRAGWVDLRGHPTVALTDSASERFTDDRVGLGPADVLVLHLGGSPADAELNDSVIDASVMGTDAPPEVIAHAVRERMGGLVAAVGVPAELGSEPLQRVASVTGIPVDEVQSPGYPLGDLQPDLWKHPPRPPRLARLRLSADRNSVSAVRSLLDRLLASWRLDGRLDPYDVKLVATELAANAVIHTDAPEAVSVRYLGDVVRIEVSDGSPEQPQRRPATVDAGSGRGLNLVDAIGSAWGTEQVAGGKRVWCDLAVTTA
jgi:anti-sigma regulatory factor (Ser/Thr protein kinase)